MSLNQQFDYEDEDYSAKTGSMENLRDQPISKTDVTRNLNNPSKLSTNYKGSESNLSSNIMDQIEKIGRDSNIPSPFKNYKNDILQKSGRNSGHHST